MDFENFVRRFAEGGIVHVAHSGIFGLGGWRRLLSRFLGDVGSGSFPDLVRLLTHGGNVPRETLSVNRVAGPLKTRIESARLSAARSVNRELILLYWDIGRGIVEKQTVEGWGESVVERLAADLRAEFTDLRGFSGRNLRDMRCFYLAYSDTEFQRQLVAKMTSTPEAIRPQVVAELERSIFPAE